MTKKSTKKNGVTVSFDNTTQNTRKGDIRLIADHIDPKTFEATQIVLFTSLGAIPNLPLEEAMQTIYDTLKEGVSLDDLVMLGDRLARLQPGSLDDVLQ